ncbi:hypothetical protein EZV62_000393 [Acer yangbiense]|uniref:60S ribosomal protein L34 n=1 Tax=Acer yangbiense TaxID=1000413 RepID=A0A5C7ISK9_9ROSI|nr:hypothetical protein EZV62_000393 [Acer yangbiense]
MTLHNFIRIHSIKEQEFMPYDDDDELLLEEGKNEREIVGEEQSTNSLHEREMDEERDRIAILLMHRESERDHVLLPSFDDGHLSVPTTAPSPTRPAVSPLLLRSTSSRQLLLLFTGCFSSQHHVSKQTKAKARKRHSYATKSNQHRVVKTPSGKLVYQGTKKRTSGPKCPVTGKRIQGIPHLRPTEYKRSRLPRNRRTVNRAYGGVLSGGAVRGRIVRAFLVEEQKIVKNVLKIQKIKEKKESK